MSKIVSASAIRKANLYERIPFIAHFRRAAFDPGHSVNVRHAARVAMRWLQARDAQSDIVARLQVLEGVAGQNVWTWSRKGMRGLAMAQAHFDDVGAPVDPAWFKAGDTGMLRLIFGALRRVVGNEAAEDILQRGLMGMTIDGGMYTGGPWLYQVGRNHLAVKQGVLNGSEDPERVASGAGGHVFRQKAVSEIKTQKEQATKRGPGAINNPGSYDEQSGQVRDIEALPGQERAELWINMVTDPRDPLGQKVRAFIRALWSNAGGRSREALDAWMDEIETGREPNLTEVAGRFGIAASTLRRDLRVYFEKAQVAFWRNESLVKALELRLLREGKLASRKAPSKAASALRALLR